MATAAAPEPRRSADDYLIRPNPADPRLTERVTGVDHTGAPVTTSVTVERALTIYLNRQEIVTAMTIGDYPDYLAIGYLLNQNMLQPDDVVTGVDYDEDLAVAVVRTERETDYEEKLQKRVQTSGCAQGTVFGDLMEVIEGADLAGRDLAHLVALRADPQDQHHALALSRGRRDPRLRAGAGGSPAGLHGGRRAPQRGRQDRRLDVPEPRAARTTRSSTPPAASPPRW